MSVLGFRRPTTCRACGGRGITSRPVSRLAGTSARQTCRRCRGAGVR